MTPEELMRLRDHQDLYGVTVVPTPTFHRLLDYVQQLRSENNRLRKTELHSEAVKLELDRQRWMDSR